MSLLSALGPWFALALSSALVLTLVQRSYAAGAGWLQTRRLIIGLALFGLAGSAAIRAQTWTQQYPAVSPPFRAEATMSYDAVSGQVVLFGGYDYNGLLADTWTYNGTTWTQQSPVGSPSPRYGATMAFDAATGQVILFGGYDYNGPLGDTWTYEGTTWTQQSPASSPSARYAPAMAYDAAIGKLVLFGGYDGQGGYLSDTWTYNGTVWTQQSPVSSPPGRELSNMAYDATTGQVVLFGGSDTGYLGDTWTYNGTTWTQKSPPSSPPARTGSTMAYDTASGEVVLFGGENDSVVFGDTWTYNGTTWTQRNPAGSPPARVLASMAYDDASGQVVLFGGFNDLGGGGDTIVFADTWTYQALPASDQVIFNLSPVPVTFPAGITASVQVTNQHNQVPAGDVQIVDEYGNVAATLTLSDGAASTSLTGIPVGNYYYHAVYLGDSNNPGVVSAQRRATVLPEAVSLSVSCTPLPFPVSSTLNCTAPAAAATGTTIGHETYSLDGGPLVNVALRAGIGTFAVPILALGPHSLVVDFPQQTNYLASGPITVNFDVRADDQISFNLSPVPAKYPASVIASVQVANLYGHVPTGNVKILDEYGNVVKALNLSGGAGSVSLTGIPVGNYYYHAVYSGDSYNPGGVSALRRATVVR
jgi:hypothetical protein